jgi:flagellar biosynthesis protein FlhB
MAENTTPEERTEMPTERRLNELRKQGTLFSSLDITVVLTLLTGFLMMQLLWQYLFFDIIKIMRLSFVRVGETEVLSISELNKIIWGIVFLLGPKLGLLLFAVAIVASLSVMLQTNFSIKEKKLELKFSKLNPINGVKRIFSPRGLMQTGKSILKLAIILPVGFYAIKEFVLQFLTLMYLSVPGIIQFLGVAVNAVFWKVISVLIAFALFDYIWGKNQWLKENKMTKQEIKDERKSVEGDEQTKKKIQAKGLERAAQRIISNVPTADVIITNPTHYSIALRYSQKESGAPVVVAKGKGDIALRIREIAKEHKIPIVERKPLARALYASAKVGVEIPYDLFKAVAEVYAYVYKLRGKKSLGLGQQPGVAR